MYNLFLMKTHIDNKRHAKQLPHGYRTNYLQHKKDDVKNRRAI